MKKMIFTLARDGRASVDVEGAVGDECLALTKDFEDALGSLTKRELKESFREEGTVTDELHDRNDA